MAMKSVKGRSDIAGYSSRVGARWTTSPLHAEEMPQLLRCGREHRLADHNAAGNAWHAVADLLTHPPTACRNALVTDGGPIAAKPFAFAKQIPNITLPS